MSVPSTVDPLPISIVGINPSTNALTNFANVDSDGGILVAGEGVAGTPAGGVVSIQGVTSGTKVGVDVSDGTGNAITSTTINAKQRLDVNLSSEGVDNTTAPFGTQQVGGVDPTGKLQAFNTLATGEQFVRDVINTSFVSAVVAVTTTPVQVKAGASVLVNRKYARIQPLNGLIYQGSVNTVSSTTGGIMFVNQIEVKGFTDNVGNWWIVAASGTVNVYIEEGS